MQRFAIRWRHRHVRDPDLWQTSVAFEELVAANQWDLADNFDDLNERYPRGPYFD
ncbi:MAG: hypothetical protein R2705_20715 [Ilumatobacteraceae bacterium]